VASATDRDSEDLANNSQHDGHVALRVAEFIVRRRVNWTSRLYRPLLLLWADCHLQCPNVNRHVDNDYDIIAIHKTEIQQEPTDNPRNLFKETNLTWRRML